MNRAINLQDLPAAELLMAAQRACAQLASFANMLTTLEGDEGDTEDEFGLPASEVVEMAHDNMIASSRATLDGIAADFSSHAPPAPG